MRKKAVRKSQNKVIKYIVRVSGKEESQTREFSDRYRALKLAEARDAQGFFVTVVNRQGAEIFRSAPRIPHKIIRGEGQYRARIHDAPFGRWRPLFVMKDGLRGLFDSRGQALAGVQLYEAWEQRGALIEAEVAALLEYIMKRGSPDSIPVPALVYLGNTGQDLYVGFHLPADFIKARSDLKIMVYRTEKPVDNGHSQRPAHQRRQQN